MGSAQTLANRWLSSPFPPPVMSGGEVEDKEVGSRLSEHRRREDRSHL